MSFGFDCCCGSCCSGTSPQQIVVQISGVTNYPPNILGYQCTGCALLNGTYVLSYNSAQSKATKTCIYSISGLNIILCSPPIGLNTVVVTSMVLSISPDGKNINITLLGNAVSLGSWFATFGFQCVYKNLIGLVLTPTESAWCNLSFPPISSAIITNLIYPTSGPSTPPTSPPNNNNRAGPIAGGPIAGGPIG